MKHLGALLMSIFLGFVLLGCGGGGDETSSTQQDPTTTTNDQTTQTPPVVNPQLEIAKQVILQQGCGSCHAIKTDGLDLNGQVGPDLTNQASRNRTAEWLRLQLSNPTAIPDSEVAEGYAGMQAVMPSYDRVLSAEELDALVMLLMSLGE